jgi:hypothetical protein
LSNDAVSPVERESVNLDHNLAFASDWFLGRLHLEAMEAGFFSQSPMPHRRLAHLVARLCCLEIE